MSVTLIAYAGIIVAFGSTATFASYLGGDFRGYEAGVLAGIWGTGTGTSLCCALLGIDWNHWQSRSCLFF